MGVNIHYTGGVRRGNSPLDESNQIEAVWRKWRSIRISHVSGPSTVMHWEKSPLIALRGDAALTGFYCAVL